MNDWRYCVFYIIGAGQVLLSSFLSILYCKPFDPKVIIFSRIDIQYTVKYICNKNLGATLITLIMTITMFFMTDLFSTRVWTEIDSDAEYQNHTSALMSYCLGCMTIYTTVILMKSYFKTS